MAKNIFNEAITELGIGGGALLLTLPDGTSEGRFEAVEWWAEICTEARKRYEMEFQFIPHSYVRTDNPEGQALYSILALPMK